MKTTALNRMVRELASAYGIQIAYYDVEHRRHQASIESLMQVLRLLGAPVNTEKDVPEALRETAQSIVKAGVEPVSVSRGDQTNIDIYLPPREAESVSGELFLEHGENYRFTWHDGAAVQRVVEVEGMRYFLKRLTIHETLPPGYHRLVLETASNQFEVLIIAAPLTAYSRESLEKTWGIFVPLYSLYTQRSWGSADLSDLETLVRWVDLMGGGMVATLPLLPIFFGEPFDPSPYAPVSRLAWNEFYVDIERAPDYPGCPGASELLSSNRAKDGIRALRTSRLVDYQDQMKVKRPVLEQLSKCFFAGPSRENDDFGSFLAENGSAQDYAAFRAVCERQRSAWSKWPSPLREGSLSEQDYDENVMHYYLYSQWLLHRQMKELSRNTRDHGLGLFLDFTVGVHPDGFDVWHRQDIFVHNASVGAPPDPAFTNGQNWNIPPLHPTRMRQAKYSYLIDCFRHHMRHAGVLRIDHMMGLHRLFWIPKGMEASQGVYVRYPKNELYSILALESVRNRVLVVGEDLGTVPPDVRPEMRRHGIFQSYVLQYELAAAPDKDLRPIPELSVASLNTHDMPPFATFWEGSDIAQRMAFGLLDKPGAASEEKRREVLRESVIDYLHRKGLDETLSSGDPRALLRALVRLIGASSARVVLINLEDLWLEREAQNVPGSRNQYPNWRRKARYGFDDFTRMPEVIEILQELDGIRKAGSADDS